jgi:hypothetical protein
MKDMKGYFKKVQYIFFFVESTVLNAFLNSFANMGVGLIGIRSYIIESTKI